MDPVLTASVAAIFVLLFLTSPCMSLSVVDLTHTLGRESLFTPINPPFNFTILTRGNQTGEWMEMNAFSVGEHGGTHADAPSHFREGGLRAHEVPAANLVGPSAVIDVTSKAAADADYRMSVQDILDWEAIHGRLPRRAIVLMNSGWGRRYPNATAFFGTQTPHDFTTFHFPGIHPDAATFLVTQRDVIAVGVDTPSVDSGATRTFPTHVIIFKYNVIAVEYVANLDDLPSRGATVVIGMVKLRDGSGGPARVLGLLGDLEDSGTRTGSAPGMFVHVWSVCSALFFSMTLAKRL